MFMLDLTKGSGQINTLCALLLATLGFNLFCADEGMIFEGSIGGLLKLGEKGNADPLLICPFFINAICDIYNELQI